MSLSCVRLKTSTASHEAAQVAPSGEGLQASPRVLRAPAVLTSRWPLCGESLFAAVVALAVHARFERRTFCFLPVLTGAGRPRPPVHPAAVLTIQSGCSRWIDPHRTTPDFRLTPPLLPVGLTGFVSLAGGVSLV